jgi:hypothetical protein
MEKVENSKGYPQKIRALVPNTVFSTKLHPKEDGFK